MINFHIFIDSLILRKLKPRKFLISDFTVVFVQGGSLLLMFPGNLCKINKSNIWLYCMELLLWTYLSLYEPVRSGI